MNIKNYFLENKKVSFIGIFLVLLSIFVTVTYVQKTSFFKKKIEFPVTEVVRYSFAGVENKKSNLKWEELISEGKTFGLDFSGNVFSQTTSLEKVTRTCAVNQKSLIHFKVRSTSMICSLLDGFTVVQYFWITKGMTLDEFVASNTKEISTLSLARGVKDANQIEVSKVKELNGISYYAVKIGKDYSVYRGDFVIENETMKALGVKFVVSTYARMSDNFYPGDKERSLQALQVGKNYVEARSKAFKDKLK